MTSRPSVRILLPLLLALTGVMGMLTVLLCSSTAFAATNDGPIPLPHTICASAPVPHNWIITNTSTQLFACGDWNPLDHNNVLWIAPPPHGPTTMCAISAVPAGFVITAEHTDLLHCKGLPADVDTITPATGTTPLTICASSPIPPLWVVTAEYTAFDRPQANATCQRDATLAALPTYLTSSIDTPILLKTIQLVSASDMQICPDSPVPSSYQVVSTDLATTACHGPTNIIAPIGQPVEY